MFRRLWQCRAHAATVRLRQYEASVSFL